MATRAENLDKAAAERALIEADYRAKYSDVDVDVRFLRQRGYVVTRPGALFQVGHKQLDVEGLRDLVARERRLVAPPAPLDRSAPAAAEYSATTPAIRAPLDRPAPAAEAPAEDTATTPPIGSSTMPALDALPIKGGRARMGTKQKPGRFDCYDRAKPTEPRFTLLGRDPQAPAAIARWAEDRLAAIKAGEKPDSDADLVVEALDCARAMIAYRQRLEAKKAKRAATGPADAGDDDWRRTRALCS
jgi:hypothetical protein